jgi:hypothetical protein
MAAASAAEAVDIAMLDICAPGRTAVGPAAAGISEIIQVMTAAMIAC